MGEKSYSSETSNSASNHYKTDGFYKKRT